LFLFSGLTLYAQPLRFRMEFTYDTTQLSAMLILKTEGETLKGSMVNEFGVNFVEFTVRNGKAKIIRINPMLKRPFLQKILRRDFELLADCLHRAAGDVIRSKKRGIYRASCIKRMDEETKLLSLHLEHQNLPLTINLYPF
jgi:hypothetical protein